MIKLMFSAFCFLLGIYLISGTMLGFKNKDTRKYTFYLWIITISAFIVAPLMVTYFLGVPYNIGAALIAFTITALFILPLMEKWRRNTH
jgi:hypothetical protein